jgi:AcrR family transcriptional regulator
MEVVTAAGLELFAEKPSRQVTVVDIAKRASVARASMLLQFPDGISDVLAAAVNVEYERILDVEKQLWDRKPPKTVLDAMYRLVEAIHSRAVATGNLYANLLSEALQTSGPHRGHVDGAFGLLGTMFAFRAGADLGDNEGWVSSNSIALGEALARSTWSASASDWAVSGLMKYKDGTAPSALSLSYVIAEALLPRLREYARDLPPKPIVEVKQRTTNRQRRVSSR